jgi:hypothetical protein
LSQTKKKRFITCQCYKDVFFVFDKRQNKLERLPLASISSLALTLQARPEVVFPTLHYLHNLQTFSIS